MFIYLRHATTPIWLLLVLATGLSWWLGHESGGDKLRLTATAMIFIAAFKIRLVVRHFMEVGNAPQLLQWLLDTWLGLMILGILGMYWLR